MLLLWCIISCLLILHGEAAIELRPRIVQGVRAKPGDFPYQVSLQAHSQLNCGGVIIDEIHVITAAHCIRDYNFKPQDLSVVVGSVDLQTDPGTRYQVLDAKVHEKYSRGYGFPNDIALLRLGSPIRFNEFVKPAKLPERDYELKSGQAAVVSGYGRLHSASQLSPRLHVTQVFIVDNAECQKHYYHDLIRGTNVCTNNPRRQTGWCKGDSGGPLTVDGIVVGLVSFSLGEACADSTRSPQVYTRVSDYVEWINYWRNNFYK